MLRYESRLPVVAQQASGHRHGAAGIEYMDYGLAIMRRDLDRGVRPARGRAADQQRQFETETLHFTRYVDHLVERWRDQPAEADQVCLLGFGPFEDLLAWDHHTHIDHF